MTARLSDRTALITGSSSGIGKGIAKLFAEEGAQVMVTGLEPELCASVAAEIESTGGTAAHHVADLTVDSQVEQLVASTVGRFGGIDILVNNAGAPGMARERDGSVEDTEPELWDATYRIDVRSVMLATKLAVPYLETGGHGSVINLGSVMAFRANRWNAYVMAKGAIVSLSRSMAVSLAAKGIRVNCICPGHIIVERTEAMWRDNPALHEAALAKMMLSRSGLPRDIAYGAVYLAADESSFVTGTVLNIDGGASALW